MNRINHFQRFALLNGLLLALAGCQGPQVTQPVCTFLPNENTPVSLTEYIANPPDILFIEMEAVPSDKHEIEAGDILDINVANALPDHPLAGVFPVGFEGTVDLGYYGKVIVAGVSIAQAKLAIEEHLKAELAEPKATVFLANARPISGDYLVRPDGTVSLGFYGTVHVAGKTLTQIKDAIREHLIKTKGFVDPKVHIDVSAYNSMVYYVLFDGGTFGDQLSSVPMTGKETVLDALAGLGGLPSTGSKFNIWIARPVQGDPNAAQILPVDWVAITKHGSMQTNYQILANDRLYVQADRLTTLDAYLTKVLAPVERILGTITLWQITTESLGANDNLNRGGGLGGF